MSDSKLEQLIQDIHGSRIVRTLTSQGWDTVLFCPWPSESETGVPCKDLSEAIQLARDAKSSREAAAASATGSAGVTEKAEPEPETEPKAEPKSEEDSE